jgi:sec-independent protein translocase protein TatB
MLDIGFQEILVIMVIALLVFGPDKLPELGRRVGKLMREFRRASDDFRSTVETNLHLAEDILPPSASLEPVAAPAGAPAAPASPASADGPEGEPGAAAEGGAGGEAEPGPGSDEPGEPFWTSRSGRLLHRRGCGWRGRVREEDRVAVKSAADGWAQGLLPCPACDPREAEVTS